MKKIERNAQTIEQTNYEKAKEIKMIRDNYVYSASRLNSIIRPNSNLTKEDYRFYVNAVQETFKDLDVISKQFISNDFFYPGNPDWWIKTYSRSTYYRLRGEAIKKFVALFNAKICRC